MQRGVLLEIVCIPEHFLLLHLIPFFYNTFLIFRYIFYHQALLKGIDVRIEADAPLTDLQIVSREEQIKREKELEQRILTMIEKEKKSIYIINNLFITRDCLYSGTFLTTAFNPIFL